jgi:hypothetical protein
VNKKLADGLYSHSIERIDNCKYKNRDYDIRVQETIIDYVPQMYAGDLEEIFTRSILK